MTKGPNAFRTISEASEDVGVPQHVLRFWETKFSFIAPVKRAGGRRFYRPQDVEILKGVRRMLHDEGMTLKGVDKAWRAGGLKRITGVAEAADATPAPAVPDGAGLAAIARSLDAARARLDAVLTA